MSDRLTVRQGGVVVGHIARRADGALTFSYADAWRSSSTAHALSSTLPLTDDAFDASYFTNLLPDGDARALLARRMGISEENDFEFLRRFGADCAGALTIVDDDDPPLFGVELADQASLVVDEALGRELQGAAGFTVAFARGARLSLAGAQPKLAVVVENERLVLPLDGRPTTHIVKLPNPRFGGLVENEAIVLGLARAVGLPVVDTELVRVGGAPALLVARFDRRVTSSGVVRLEQRDLCQVLGLPPERKYEREGGPSLKVVFDVVRDTVVDPLPAARALLSWVAFNVVVHNADAHAKNLALLRAAGRESLAPFYDLVCTGAFPSIDRSLAMGIGGRFDPDALSRAAWDGFAHDVGLGKKLVREVIERTAIGVKDALPRVIDDVTARVGRVGRRQQVERAIRRRVEGAVRSLS